MVTMDAENPVVALVESYEASQREIAGLRESLEEVRAMMDYEDRGWAKILGSWAAGDHLEGLDLEEVQEIARKIEPKVVGGSLPKRAVDLHSGFVFGRGYFIEGTAQPKGQGRPTGIRNFFTDTTNQESLFSDAAGEELQKARFIDGNVLAACNTKTKEVNRIPFKQIKGIKVDPEFPENIIAYLREWDTQDGSQNSVKKLWYYTARFSGKRQKSFTKNRETINVAENVTIVDLRANRQVGHVLGVPDALAGLLWSEAYGRIISYGETVQESLAKILFRVTNKTKQGVQSSGVKIGNFGGHGGTASMMEGQELSAVQTAGKGYDFSSARPVAAMAAAAWNVSNMDLLNDSSAAGSSYGSANALVGGNRNAMLLMQKQWAEFFKRIFDVMGFNRPKITFEPFESPDQYRSSQALKLNSTHLSDEEIRGKALDIMDIAGDPSELPDKVKVANDLAKASADSSAAQAAAPDQGQGNGTGGGGQGANDQRSDTLSSQENLRHEMSMETIVEKFQSLVERVEALSQA